MGITGLLSAVGRGQETKMSQLRNKSVAIDGHCFLHRSCLFAPEQLLLKNDTSRIVKYMRAMVDDILKATQANVFLVFDGGCLPLKAETDNERRSKRAEHLREYERLKDEQPSEARDHLVHAFHISAAHLSDISQQLLAAYQKEKRFFLIHAPYEADAQVAFLNRAGLADVIITNDSDILLYDVSSVLFAYDPKVCAGRLVANADIYSEQFAGLSIQQVRKICILSGCDYVSSLKGVGLKGAHKALVAAGFDETKAVDALLKLGKPCQYDSVEEYQRLVLAAKVCFEMHVIYNPFSGKLESFMQKEAEEIGFPGKFYGDTSKEIALHLQETCRLKLAQFVGQKYDASFRK